MALKPYFQSQYIEAGCDEAGRGCLAGPVVAAAVILPTNFEHSLLNDSKQLNSTQRNLLKPIIEREALAWAIGIVDQKEIDSINILNASFKAMHLAIDQLQVRPGLLLIDGNRFAPYWGIPHQCIVKGDSQFATIAAASILAKTYRDALMEELDFEFPHYGWKENKGYPTAFHKNAIQKWGRCKYHRLSFKLKSLGE